MAVSTESQCHVHRSISAEPTESQPKIYHTAFWTMLVELTKSRLIADSLISKLSSWPNIDTKYDLHTKLRHCRVVRRSTSCALFDKPSAEPTESRPRIYHTTFWTVLVELIKSRLIIEILINRLSSRPNIDTKHDLYTKLRHGRVDRKSMSCAPFSRLSIEPTESWRRI